MKTRIISATVGIILFAIILVISISFNPALLIALALLNVIAVYEMLRNTKISNSPPIIIAALLFSAFYPFGAKLLNCGALTIAAYIILVAVLSIENYSSADNLSIFAGISAPVLISYAFTSIYNLFIIKNCSHLYFVLIFIFAWGADTAAYFGGTFFGKHKLAPEVSPKKTVEGSVFGILGALLLSIITAIIYASCGIEIKWGFLIVCAVIFSFVGMIGDLLTSQIKRNCGIKDYGNIMPGHGGVLDRFDSVLMIAPIFYLAIEIFNII